MPSFADSVPRIQNSIVTTVSAGSTAILNCTSNDFEHNFMLWYNKNNIIAPGNSHNERKFKYEVLSGSLHINNVSPSDSGQYVCISKNLDGSGYLSNEVEMLVSGSTFSPVDAVKLVAIIVSIIVIICSALLYYKLKKDWKKYEGRSVVPVHDIDDEDVDEVYNSTTTSISHPVPGPSRNPSSEQLLYGIDNQGLDTDFHSVFENIQIKSPERSLI